MKISAATILLVDDDDSLRRVLEFQLAEAGYEVTSSSNGHEVLAAISSEEFDPRPRRISPF